MVGRVERLGGENLGEHRIDGLVAADRQPLIAIEPDLQREERLGFELFGVILHDLLEGADQVAARVLSSLSPAL